MALVYFATILILITPSCEMVMENGDLIDADQSKYHVSKRACNYQMPLFYNLNYLYHIPNFINENQRFSPSHYYLTKYYGTSLIIVMQHVYEKVEISNLTNTSLYYKAKLTNSSLKDLTLALKYEAKYYIDINPSDPNHKLKYICNMGQSDYNECYNFQLYQSYPYEKLGSLQTIRIQISGNDINFMEIYLNDSNNLYAIKRSKSENQRNKLKKLKNNLTSPLYEMIFEVKNELNWTKLVTVGNPLYRFLRQNVNLVIGDCSPLPATKVRKYTMINSINTYISTKDNLCQLINKNGLYNLMFVKPFDTTYINNIYLQRDHENNKTVGIKFGINLNIQRHINESYDESIIIDSNIILLMKLLELTTLDYRLNYSIKTNETIGDDVIQLSFLRGSVIKYIPHLMQGDIKVELQQLNFNLIGKYITEQETKKEAHEVLLVAFRYYYAYRNKTEDYPAHPLYYITSGNNNFIKKTLQNCAA